MFTRKFI